MATNQVSVSTLDVSCAISDQRSAISDQRSAISDQRSAISDQRSAHPTVCVSRAFSLSAALRGRLIPCAVALILGGASLAKTQKLWMEGMGEATLSSLGLVALIELELALALGLASDLWPRVLRGIGLALFAAFVGFLFSRAAAGERSCCCAGNLEISVYAMIFVDLCVLIGLWCWHPAIGPCSPSVKMGLPAVLLLLAPWPLWAAFRPAPYPRLIVPAFIDVGRITPGERRTLSIPLRNPHDRLVEVVAIESSCPCVADSSVPVRVAPGQERTLALILDFSHQPGFTGSLVVEIKGKAAEQGLAVLTRLGMEVWEHGFQGAETKRGLTPLLYAPGEMATAAALKAQGEG